jgi:anti-anti-sigma factor
VLTFAVSGEFDLERVPDIRKHLTTLVAASPGATITIDLSQVSFLDSSALGVLVGVRRIAQQTDVDIVLHAPRPNVWKVLTITGMDKVFECTDVPDA